MESDRRTFVVGRKLQNHINPSMYAPRKYNSHTVVLPAPLKKVEDKHVHMEIPRQRSKHAAQAQPASNPLQKPIAKPLIKETQKVITKSQDQLVEDLSLQIITTALINGLAVDQLLADLKSNITAKIVKTLQPTPERTSQVEQADQVDQQSEPGDQQEDQVDQQSDQQSEPGDQQADQQSEPGDQQADQAVDHVEQQVEQDLPQPSQEPE